MYKTLCFGELLESAFLLRLGHVYFMCVKLQSQVVIGICERLLPTIIG